MMCIAWVCLLLSAPRVTCWSASLDPLLPHHGPALEAARRGLAGARTTHHSVVLGIASARANFERRQVIRETWLRDVAAAPGGAPFSVRFLVGVAELPGEDPLVDAKVRSEMEEHEDMVLLGVVDTYRNVVLKVLHFASWVLEHAPTMRYLSKMDDDVYLNVDSFARLLEEGLPHHSDLAAHGHVWSAAPIRDPSHKNWISRERFPQSRFPPFVQGAHYIWSRALVSYLSQNQQVLDASLVRDCGALEDAQFGIFFSALRVQLTHDGGFAGPEICHRGSISVNNIDASAMRGAHASLHSVDHDVERRTPCAPEVRTLAIEVLRHRLERGASVPLVALADTRNNLALAHLLRGKPGDLMMAQKEFRGACNMVPTDGGDGRCVNADLVDWYVDGDCRDDRSSRCYRRLQELFERGLKVFASHIAEPFYEAYGVRGTDGGELVI